MSESSEKKTERAELWPKVLAGIAAVVALACLTAVLYLWTQYKRVNREMENLRGEVMVTTAPTQAKPTVPPTEPTQETEATEPVVTCTPVIDFTAAQKTNEDIYAWIQVPGTTVDYPVLQSVVDNYYLTRNLDKSDGYPGCLYTNRSANSRDFEDYITVIYGHNMPNNLMFTSLHNLEDKQTFEENRTFTVYTEENRLTYEILAAVWYGDCSIPYYYETNRFEGAQSFWDSVLTECDFHNEPSNILDGAVLEEGDKLCVLSTCIRQNGVILKGRRYLVIGRLVETAVYSDAADQ